MHTYFVNDGIENKGRRVTIFADSFQQAADIFFVWRMHFGEDVEQFTVAHAVRSTKWEPRRRHMLEAQARRVPGIGLYEHEVGYVVVSPLDAPDWGDERLDPW